MVLGPGYRSWACTKCCWCLFLETHVGQKCPGASMLVTERLEVFCFLSWGHWILDKSFRLTMTTNTTINILITVFFVTPLGCLLSAEFGTGFLGSGVNSGFFTTPSTASKKNHSNLQQNIAKHTEEQETRTTKTKNACKWMIATRKLWENEGNEQENWSTILYKSMELWVRHTIPYDVTSIGFILVILTQGLELKHHDHFEVMSPPPPPPSPPSPSPSTIVKLALAPQKCTPGIPQCAPLVHPSHLKGPSLQISNSRVPDSPILTDKWNQSARIFWIFLASKTKIWSKDIFNDFCWHSPTYLMNISQNCISSTRFRSFWKDSLLLNYPRWGFMNSERQ